MASRPSIGGHLGGRTHRDDDRRRFEPLGALGRRHVDSAGPRDSRIAANAAHAGLLEAREMAGIVRVRPILAVDHVVATGGRLRPGIVPAERVNGRRMEQRLGGNAGPERAGATEQVAFDDGHAGASLASLVGGRLTARAGADDHEVETIHPSRTPSNDAGPVDRAVCSRRLRCRMMARIRYVPRGSAGMPRWRRAS